MQLLVLTVFFPFLVWGQNRVGNGGDVISCPTFVRLLDLYESEFELAKLDSTNEWDYANTVFSSMEAHAPKFAAQYKSRLQQLRDEIDFRDDISLKNIKDSNHIVKPLDKKCKIKQIAVRKNWNSSQTKKFLVSNALWKELDIQNKSALLTHEVIYEHFYKLGDFDSVKARELNRWLYEARFAKVSKKEFWNFIKSLELPIYQD